MSSILKVLFISLCICLFSCTTNDIENSPSNVSIDLSLVNQNNWDLSNDILDLINDYRLNLGKSTLIKDTLCATAYAVSHSKYMIDTKSVNHNNFFIRSQGLKDKGAQKVSENIAYAYTSAQSVVTAWLKSDAHRKTIEDEFTHIGFGIVKSSNNNYYYTTLFYK